jgi:hypothetical protein
MAALVAPRPLYLEAGENDELFDVNTFLTECKRTEAFYEAAEAADRLKYSTHEGIHEFCKEDDGIAFIFQYI